MKPKTISLTRRNLMIAGIAGAAAPAVSLAGQPRASKDPVSEISIARGDTLLVSGRVVDAAQKPLAGARIEALQHGVAAATDGDGRFVLTATAARTSRGVLCRVSHAGRSRVTYLAFTRKHRAPRDGTAVLDRDERGTWRTTCGLSVA